MILELDNISTDDRRKLHDLINSPRRVAIVGRPNAGKSTFINALLGRNLLPCHRDACTAITTEVRYYTSLVLSTYDAHR